MISDSKIGNYLVKQESPFIYESLGNVSTYRDDKISRIIAISIDSEEVRSDILPCLEESSIK